ncbi:MAG: hypothetical protein ABJ004_16655 [Cyclobacteriaceae bacterium]
MIKFLKRIPIYIRIFEDQIIVRRLDNGEGLGRTAELPFSNNRLLLADFDNLYELLNSTLIELDKGIVNKYKFIFQLVTENLNGVAQTEKMCLNDLGLKCGANWVYIVEHANELTDIELQRLLDKR